MARTEFDRQLEQGVEEAGAVVARFLSGAPLDGEPRPPGGLPRGVIALIRVLVTVWVGWAAWMWWYVKDHERVIYVSAGAAGLLLPVVVIAAVRGRKRRQHQRSLVYPMALALKELLSPWDEHHRMRAVTIPLDRSFVAIKLPDGWHDPGAYRDQMRDLVQQRMGGLWAGEWNLKNHPFNVVFTPHQPKPKPEPPETVDFFADVIQDAIAACKPGQIVLGLDEHHKPFIKEMTGETAMWALSVGSGGGKSSFLQMVITQLVRQRATVLGVDVKMASIICFQGVEGVHLYTDPGNIGDMRAALSWVAKEVQARNYLKKQNPKKDFDRLTVILEEGNEFGDASKEWWNENKEKGDPAADPIWGDIASIMRMGRHVNVTIIGVFQDLREAAVGNRGLRNMFRFLMLGNFNANQWRMIVNTSPVPDSVDRAGRMLAIEGNRRVWIQVPYADPDAFREHALELRTKFGYSTGDLYGTPPAASPESLPSLLQTSTPLFTKNSGDDATAPAIEAGPSAPAVDAAERPALVKEGPQVPGEPAQSNEEPGEELLSLAEVARRLAADGIKVSPELMRQHKRRRDDFPAGTLVDGKELFRLSDLALYYGPDDAEPAPESKADDQADDQADDELDDETDDEADDELD
ncbi:hypothetical protein PV726_32170 [Streptomyces europaeiscabiei]|uniref:hypothetical protein n=1 Tax=Streptomyces europaeiscabiei TaxID=146819 RepID=UPI0029BDECD0|nr:hypothetical protein [Streptomyces europaeiscabiei]MDX3694913.1 hypothetical protein [Streptomyces europaeiscabiei]